MPLSGKVKWPKSSFQSSVENSSTSLSRLDRICVAPRVNQLVNSSWKQKAQNDRSLTRWLTFFSAKQPIRIDLSRKTQVAHSKKWRQTFAFTIQFAQFAPKVLNIKTPLFELRPRIYSISFAKNLVSIKSSVLTQILGQESACWQTWQNFSWIKIKKRDDKLKSSANFWNGTSSSSNISLKTSITTKSIRCVKSWTHWRRSKINGRIKFWNLVQVSREQIFRQNRFLFLMTITFSYDLLPNKHPDEWVNDI